MLRIHETPPEQLFLAHLAPFMKETETNLEAEISQMEAENAQLLKSMRESEEEADKMAGDLEIIIKDLESASEVVDDAVSGGDLKREVRNVDEQIVARDVGRESRL